MWPHPLAKFFGPKLVRIGKIWLDLYKIWAKLGRNFGKIEAKFGQK